MNFEDDVAKTEIVKVEGAPKTGTEQCRTGYNDSVAEKRG